MPYQENENLEAFDAKLAQSHMRGQWTSDATRERGEGGSWHDRKWEPNPGGVPYLWQWNNIYDYLVEACQVIPHTNTARRSLLFNNPGLKRGTTHTLITGIQMIRPGELAWAHRHSITALRFVIQGSSNVFTVVDGEPCPMEDFDLVLTPNWSWHDHHNRTDQPAIWLDVLDGPVISSLNQVLFESFGEKQQPMRNKPTQATQKHSQKDEIIMRFPWRQTKPKLMALTENNETYYDGLVLEYANPITGGPVLQTIGCWVQLLRPGLETQLHRHSSSAVYFVMQGSGKTIVDDVELAWGKNDCFVVPNWAWHKHLNQSMHEPAILFSVNDIPLLQALGLYREEPEISLQKKNPFPVIENMITTK